MWPAELKCNLLFRGKIRKRSLTPPKKPKLTIQKSRLADKNINLEEIMKNEPLGSGEFGATYEVNDTTVLKVIDLASSKSTAPTEEEIFREFHIHKQVQNLILPDNKPCIPPILEGPHKDNEKVYFIMPKLTKFKPLKKNFNRIIECATFMIKNGFLHNDLHQGNIMMYGDFATIIDLGLTIEYIPCEDDHIMDCIIFAQISALIDDCNTNTACKKSIISLEKDMQPLRKKVVEMFKLEEWDSNKIDVKKLYRKVEDIMKQYNAKKQVNKISESNDIVLKSQLLLACLSTRFKACNYHPFCENKEVDYIYAIRNPSSANMTLSDVLDHMKEGKKLII